MANRLQNTVLEEEGIKSEQPDNNTFLPLDCHLSPFFLISLFFRISNIDILIKESGGIIL